MKNEMFTALSGYKAAMSQAKIMLSKGMITAEEYGIIETKMCLKYGINFSSLYRENDWLYTPFRGNMLPTKEVIS